MTKETDEGTTKGLACLGGMSLGLGMIILLPILNGFVLTLLWSWFLMPQFHLTRIAIPEAIGICLVSSFLTHQIDRTKDQYQDNTKGLTGAFVFPLITLLFGWILHFYVH